jgi:hypothetical protein
VAASGNRHYQKSNPGRTFASGALPRWRPLRVTCGERGCEKRSASSCASSKLRQRSHGIGQTVCGRIVVDSLPRRARPSRLAVFVVHALPVRPSVSESLSKMMMTRVLLASAVALALGLLSQTGADSHGSPDSRDGHPALLLYLSCRGCQSTGLRRSRLRWWERPLKRVTFRRRYRCLRCQWRGWLKPPEVDAR